MQLDGLDLWRYGRNPNNGISRPSLGWDTLETRRHKASLASLYKMWMAMYDVAIPETYHPAPKPHRQTRLSNTGSSSTDKLT